MAAVAPWEGVHVGQRRRPWSLAFAWYLCVFVSCDLGDSPLTDKSYDMYYIRLSVSSDLE